MSPRLANAEWPRKEPRRESEIPGAFAGSIQMRAAPTMILLPALVMLNGHALEGA